MAKRFVATSLVHDARFHIVLFEVVSILPTGATLVGVYPSTFKVFWVGDSVKIYLL